MGEAGEERQWVRVETATEEDLFDVFALAADDAWIVGDHGTTLHWDGARWSASVVDRALRLTRVWASGPRDVWALGRDTRAAAPVLLRWGGVSWSRVAHDWHGTLEALWGSSPDDVWLVGGHVDGVNVWHFDGARWSDQYSGMGSFDARGLARGFLSSVTGSSSRDVWVAFSADAYGHFDGARWSTFALGAYTAVPRATWLSAQSELFFASLGPATLRCHQGSCAALDYEDEPRVVQSDGGVVPAGVLAFEGLWGPSANDLWYVGIYTPYAIEGSSSTTPRALLSHYDGVTRRPVSLGDCPALHAVHGTRRDDVWAVGDRGAVLHLEARAP